GVAGCALDCRVSRAAEYFSDHHRLHDQRRLRPATNAADAGFLQATGGLRHSGLEFGQPVCAVPIAVADGAGDVAGHRRGFPDCLLHHYTSDAFAIAHVAAGRGTVLDQSGHSRNWLDEYSGAEYGDE